MIVLLILIACALSLAGIYADDPIAGLAAMSCALTAVVLSKLEDMG